MSSLNKVMLIGHLGKDPDVRYTADGTTVANFTMATTEKWKDKSGAKQERTEWHRVTCWARLGEIAGEYLNKGSLVYIEGSIRTNKYTDKEGVEKYSTEINCTQLTMLGGKSDSTGSGAASNTTRNKTEPGKTEPSRSKETDDFDDKDIPF